MTSGNSTASAKAMTFNARGLRLQGLAWEQGPTPVLALHGWLDNAASFDRVAPGLMGCHVVAPDLAGHGLSDHRSEDASYNIWDDVAEVIAIADQLGWTEFALVGHSRGAIIANLISAAFPDRVTHLALVEGIWPPAFDPTESAGQLAKWVLDAQKLYQRQRRYYPSLEAAISAREEGFFTLSRDASKRLAARGVIECPEGCYWSHDPRLMGASAMKLTAEHCDAFSAAVVAPTLLIVADEGASRLPEYEERLQRFPNISVERLVGSHHLHMEDQAAAVTQLIQRLIV